MTAPATTTIDLGREACDARLFDALLYATMNPDNHRQSTWGVTDKATAEGWADQDWPTCETAACLFGTAIIRAGLAEPGCRFTPDRLAPRYWIQLNEAGQDILDALGHNPVWDSGLEFTTVGARLFGLTLDRARNLSAPDNTLRELWDMALMYTDGRVRMPLELMAAVTVIDDAREGAPMYLDTEYAERGE